MRKAWNLIWRLSLICIIAGLSLGVTNELTKDPIAKQNMLKENAAFLAVMTPDAVDFEPIETPAEGVDKAVAGMKDGTAVGYAAQVTVQGYGGPIQVVVGMDKDGVITMISVGGPEFKETSGLGSKTKDPGFTDQFKSKTAPVALGTDIDGISGATISSAAVVKAVNTACEYMSSLLGIAVETPEEPVLEAYKAVLPDAVDFEQVEAAEGIDLAYAGKKDGAAVGYSAQVTVQGYGGPVEVTVGMDMTGSIVGISVGGSEFNETEGLGSKIQDPGFTDQFKAKTAPVALGTDIDAITGATISSTAVVTGVNTASEFLNGLLGLAVPEEPEVIVEPHAAVLPDAVEFEEIEAAEGIDIAYVGKKEGTVVGYTARVTAAGYGGPVEVTVGIDLTGAITDIVVGGEKFAETPGLGSKVKEPGFTDQFKTKTAPLTLGSDIDAVTSATVSSTAVVKAVNTAFEFLAGLIG